MTVKKPEPSERLKSSFTEEELGMSRMILTRLFEFPLCKCKNSHLKVRIQPIGFEFRAWCEWCGFEATTVGGKWVGVETVKVGGKPRRVM